jgi:hypothetical protein
MPFERVPASVHTISPNSRMSGWKLPLQFIDQLYHFSVRYPFMSSTTQLERRCNLPRNYCAGKLFSFLELLSGKLLLSVVTVGAGYTSNLRGYVPVLNVRDPQVRDWAEPEPHEVQGELRERLLVSQDLPASFWSFS